MAIKAVAPFLVRPMTDISDAITGFQKDKLLERILLSENRRKAENKVKSENL